MFINAADVDGDVVCGDDVSCRDFYRCDDDELHAAGVDGELFSLPAEDGGDKHEQLVEAHDEQFSQLAFPAQSKHQLLENEQHMPGLVKLPVLRLRY